MWDFLYAAGIAKNLLSRVNARSLLTRIRYNSNIMLSKKERLTRIDFATFFARGKRYHSPLFQLIYTPHNTFHASVVVPKKIEKQAVKRNKIRRRAYDILRREKMNTVGVYILIAKKPITTTAYNGLKIDLLSLIRQTGKVR